MADSETILEVPPESEMVCSECGAALSEVPVPVTRTGLPSALVVGAIVALMILAFVGGYFKSGGFTKNSGAPVLASSTEPMLRLSGSNTIGAKLAPALAQEFLKELGARDIRILPGAREDEEAIQGVLPGGGGPVAIQISAHGSATAFEGLASNSCDIGMASRKVKAEEISKLSSLGDMTAPNSEHVVGLDGIAVIVSSSNAIQSLTKDQLAGIFSGAIADWSAVSSLHGAINVYARDDKSGTYDTFKTLVLGSKELVHSAKRFEDSRALSDAVAGDPNGIGFIGLPYILSAKAIGVAEPGATPFQPNRLTVGTEDYPLSRRLYLYTSANPQNKYVRRFVEFALSKAGQDVVGNIGFIAQNVVAEREMVAISAPAEYRRLTQNAGRLSLDFRFLPGRTDLDNKALMDMDRVVSYLASSGYSGNDVLLLGFSDKTGDRRANVALSQARARLVAQAFMQRGLKPATVEGFGSDLPVASNDIEAGRERNRRVEIWLKK
jgi:phosphate transport system substrate-binding protein